jgi:hypothetical protein
VVVHIVPTTANYLRFLAFLVFVSYAPVFLMPRLLQEVGQVGEARRGDLDVELEENTD